MSSSSSFPSFLLHAPFLAVRPADKSTSLPSLPLLQRNLPPSPLYYLHSAPPTIPGAPPPTLTLLPVPPINGRISTVYRAISESGHRVVLKQTSSNFLELLRETEEVYVNLPGGSLPIPTFWGIFQGGVEAGQGGMVTVLEDCGEPLEGNSFDSLTKPERHFLYNTLTTLHDIHFSHGSFSPSSVVSQPFPPSAPNPHSLTRKLTIVGYSQASWHLCEGADKCAELLEAKKALGIE